MIAKPTRLLGFVALLVLQACASSTFSSPTTPADTPTEVQVTPGVAPIPGGDYWFGLSQKPEDLESVEIAQSYYGIWSESRNWARITSGHRVAGTKGNLRAYYPLHVRWKLKDGREFILENIDVAAIMRNYFKSHSLQLPWQREGRPRAKVGDMSPTLAHEVKDDTVILKWVITLNHTPVNERLTALGAAIKWDTEDEEHIVVVLKGNPTTGIDFSKTYERIQKLRSDFSH